MVKPYAHRDRGPCLCKPCYVMTVADLVVAGTGLPGEYHIDARKMATNYYYMNKSMFSAVMEIKAELLKKATGQ